MERPPPVDWHVHFPLTCRLPTHAGAPADQNCRSDGMVSRAAAEDLDCTRPRLGKWAGTFPLRDGLARAGRNTHAGEVTHVPVRRAPRYLSELSFHTAAPSACWPVPIRAAPPAFLLQAHGRGQFTATVRSADWQGAAEGEAGWQARTTPRAAPSADPGAALASCRRRSGPVPRSRKLANAAVRTDGRRPHDGSR